MRSYWCVLVVALAALTLPSGSLRAQFGRNHPALVLDVGGHTAPVSRALFTPDGKELITVARDKTIRFWDVATGSMLRVFRPPIGPGREGELYAADLSPDGKVLAVAGFGFFRGQDKERKRHGVIYLIDTEAGEILRTLPGHGASVQVLAFTRDGKLLASGGADALIKLWDVGAGTELKTLKGHAGPVTSLAFSPDGKRLLSAGSADEGEAAARVAWIWSVEGRVVSRLAVKHQSPVAQVAWSPDGTRLATGGNTIEKIVAIWDGDGKHLKNLHYSDYPLICQSLAFTRDGKSLLVSGLDSWRSNVFKIDLANGKALATYVGESYFQAENIPFGPATVSPDGRIVAVATDRQLRVHLYDGRSSNPLRVCGGQRRPPSLVAWVREKETDRRTVVWRTTTVPKDFEYSQPFPEHFFDRAFQFGDLQPVAVPQGKDVHYQRNRWGLPGQNLDWSKTQLQLYRNKKPTDVFLEARQGLIVIDSVSFVGPERAVFATSEGTMQAFDVSEKGRGKWLGYLAGFNGIINSSAPSPDNGRYLLAGGEDQVLHVWDPRRPRKDDPTKVRPLPLLSLFVAPPRPGAGKSKPAPEWIAWTPEGYYAASAGGERLMGWHVNNGPDQMATFHPASRFRARFYRPDVMTLLLKEGSLEKALTAAEKAGGPKARDSAVTDIAQVLPPTVDVNVRGPRDGKLTITASVSRPGTEPVTALQLLIDERPWIDKAGNEALATFTKPPYKAEWTVQLPAGEHQIRVLARTASSLGTSRGYRGMVRAEEPAPKKDSRPALYVLAVGIDGYPGTLKLGGAVNDATLLKETFSKHSSSLFRTIETNLITDKTAHVPTRQGILDGLSWLKQHMTRDDVGVFFFAGHGLQDKDGEYYLLPRDGDPNRLRATALSRPELKRQMQALPGRVLVLLDACNSGAIGLLFDDLSRELTDEDCGVVVMCASRPRQPAQEKDGHGFFTRSLIGGLSGKGPSSKRDGCVYLHHLQQYVIDTVLELSHDQQHPVAVAPPWMRPFGLSKP